MVGVTYEPAAETGAFADEEDSEAEAAAGTGVVAGAGDRDYDSAAVGRAECVRARPWSACRS
ncbi:MAG: hypothetical protein ACK4KW_15220, partial [Gemmobacter sp.]